jgi:hypothetical protein
MASSSSKEFSILFLSKDGKMKEDCQNGYAYQLPFDLRDSLLVRGVHPSIGVYKIYKVSCTGSYTARNCN